jgi:hypothetical protein
MEARIQHSAASRRAGSTIAASANHFLAIRTGHGDFPWYHRKFKHGSAELKCSCGAAKTPEHIAMCRKVLGCFDRWPWPGERSRVRPESRDDRMRYLHELTESPAASKEYLEVTKYLTNLLEGLDLRIGFFSTLKA